MQYKFKDRWVQVVQMFKTPDSQSFMLVQDQDDPVSSKLRGTTIDRRPDKVVMNIMKPKKVGI